MKFGGAVLNSISGFSKMLEIVKSNTDTQCLLVISAFSKSTRDLKMAAQTAEMGDLITAKNISDKLYDEYCSFAKILLRNSNNLEILIEQYNTSFENLNDLLKGISITNELTDRTLDAIMSYGETLSLLTAYHYLQCNGINIAELNSIQVIITDDNYGAARPILSICQDNIKTKALPLFETHNIVLTQGFVASNRNGEITTMGIESSNLTAAIYAKFLNADSFVIYTDVEGIRSADPRLNSSTDIVGNLSYDQAYLLGVNGLKLIFPDMIELIRDTGIEIQIMSAYSESGECTIISHKSSDNNSIIIIEHDDYKLIKVKFRSNDEYRILSSLIGSKLQTKMDLICFTNSEFVVATKNISTWNFLTDYDHYLRPVQLLILINLSDGTNKMYHEKRIELEATLANIDFRIIRDDSSMFFKII